MMLCKGRAARPASPMAEESAREAIPRANCLSLASLSSEILKKVLTYAAPPSSPSQNIKRKTAAEN